MSNRNICLGTGMSWCCTWAFKQLLPNEECKCKSVSLCLLDDLSYFYIIASFNCCLIYLTRPPSGRIVALCILAMMSYTIFFYVHPSCGGKKYLSLSLQYVTVLNYSKMISKGTFLPQFILLILLTVTGVKARRILGGDSNVCKSAAADTDDCMLT